MNRPFYFQPPSLPPASRSIDADLCIYGATSGGVIAAVKARELGLRVVLLAFGQRVGGMTAAGLGATDIGNKQAIGGLARGFYRQLGQHYGAHESWTFEPHVAEETFLRLLGCHDVSVYFGQQLASVAKDENQIREITMADGSRYRSKIFIDASYEGDLMAAAGVSYHLGRESNSIYGELYNGVHIHSPHHNFMHFVDPYRIAGNSRSGLLPGISDEPLGALGEGDRRIQAYNFRLCLTKKDSNKIPFSAPANYDPECYTILARYLTSGIWDVLQLTKEMPGEKTDTNNFGGFSTDHIGANHSWPEADYLARERIFQDHVGYTQGLLWFLSQDERVPTKVREEVREWGLPQDEFRQTGGWPHELYIREGRRMVSDYVMTEANCLGVSRAADSIGMAAYTMDSHNCRRIVLNGRVFNEGNVEIGGFPPYPISYRSIVPTEKECANLLVPFCLSASHIAFGSIRMEPVFMVLGQSAATAAHLAIDSACPVQQVPYGELRARLLADHQVLE